MEIKAEELLYKLEKQQQIAGLEQVLVVFGEEDYFRTKILSLLPEYFLGDVEETAREITIFEKDFNIKEFNLVLNTYPFFSGKSLVIVRDDKLFAAPAPGDSETAKEKRKEKLEILSKLLENLPDYVYLVLASSKNFDKRTKFYKALQKLALVCECKKLAMRDLSAWLDAQAAEYGARFNWEAKGTIMEYLEPVEQPPLQILQQEIEKLAIFAGERKEWTRQDVESIFASLPEVSNFAVSNFLMQGKVAELLEQLAAEKKRGTNILPICALLMFKVRQALQFMELRAQGNSAKNIAADLKMHPFVADKLDKQCRRFSRVKMQEALIALTELNIDLRNGGRDYERLEEILLKLFL